MQSDKALQAVHRQCKQFFRDVYPHEKILVMGQGNPSAPMVLVGEAPGEQETLAGRPFVGQAGKNLTFFLGAIEISREDVFITNVVKFRPTKPSPKTGRPINRPPSREEIRLCSPWLYKELEAISPKLVVTLGNLALRACAHDNSLSIGACHGQTIPVQQHETVSPYWLYPLYHPASVIYNRALMDVYLQDLSQLKEMLGRLLYDMA